jgi:hypothetical protein
MPLWSAAFSRRFLFFSFLVQTIPIILSADRLPGNPTGLASQGETTVN